MIPPSVCFFSSPTNFSNFSLFCWWMETTVLNPVKRVLFSTDQREEMSIVRVFRAVSNRGFCSSARLLNAVTPAAIQLRVGLIKECKRHPDADKLYVSQISTDEASDSAYTVCSGLVNYIRHEDLLHRRVVLVTNLKPSKMRGIKSEAMVLAAEKTVDDEVNVQLVSPPVSSLIGEELFFDGYKSETPQSRLKSKKWEELQQRFQSDTDGIVVYIDDEGKEHKLRGEQSDSFATVGLKNAIVR